MGLIKTGLKAAVAVKTAHYVHDRIERRQQTQWAAQGEQTAPPAPVAPAVAPVVGEAGPTPPPAAGLDRTAVLSQLKDLGELKATGVLTEEEFVRQKALILGG
jgi:Short C-terminal domain